MDWETKFQTLVKQTESNLDRAKRRLNHTSSLSQSFHSVAEPLDNTYLSTRSLRSHNTLGTLPPTTQLSFGKEPYDTTFGSEANYHTYRESNLEHSTSVLNLLLEKMDFQRKEMASQQREILELKEERLLMNRQMQQLQDDLRRQGSKSGGLHNQQLEQQDTWRRNIQAQVNALQQHSSWQQQHRVDSGGQNLQLNALVQELLDLKRHLLAEYAELRQSLDEVRFRVAGLEGDLNYGASLNDSLKKRQDTLDGFMRNYNKELAQVKGSLEETRMSASHHTLNQVRSVPTEVYVPTSSLPLHLPKERQDYLNVPTQNPTYSKLLGRPTSGSNHTLPSPPPNFNDDNLPTFLNGKHHTADVRKSLDIDDLLTADLDDVKTADSADLELTFNEKYSNTNDLDATDNELSLDDLQ